jgi:hypothetical protein
MTVAEARCSVDARRLSLRKHFHYYSKRLVEVTCRVLLCACLGVAADSEVQAPKGAPPVIDGVVNEAEWADAATRRLSDGTAIRFRHDGRHLFLGITSTRRRFASVCIADRDTVRVFHASAALGTVSYTRSGREWATRNTEFVYGIRNTDLDQQAQQERKEYLARHGWVASTVGMGDGLAQELQISVGLVSGGARIAVAFYLWEGDSGSVVAWPEGLASDDACVDERLVRGYVPPRLGFKPNAWAALKLDNTDQKKESTTMKGVAEHFKT